MKISVKNLGILEHSEIDLSKKINVLCGPNNTGKTYMAYLVYGWNYLFTIEYESPFDFLYFKITQEQKIDNDIIINLTNVFNDNYKQIKNQLDDITGVLEKWLTEIFNQKSSFFTKTAISINAYNSLIKNIFDFKVSLDEDNDVKVIKNEGILRIPITEKLEEILKDENLFIIRVIQHTISLSIFDTSTIFPAERAAINIFSKELSIKRNDLVDELLSVKNPKNRDKLLEERATRYPLPIRESLKIAEDLLRLSQKKSDFEYLAEEIERKILKGKIKVNKYGEIQYTPNGTKNVNLPMHVSASMVKSLSSIVFYFRHLAQAGDLIIIDEPELNLHPDMQRAVARLLARFVNEGFKVLISTHSDYIIKELNILLMLNNPNKAEAKELQKKYGYQDNELLKPEEVGVYLFKDRHSEVVPVTQEGFEIDTIDKEINELNQVTKNIYFSLYD